MGKMKRTKREVEPAAILTNNTTTTNNTSSGNWTDCARFIWPDIAADVRSSSLFFFPLSHSNNILEMTLLNIIISFYLFLTLICFCRDHHYTEGDAWHYRWFVPHDLEVIFIFIFIFI